MAMRESDVMAPKGASVQDFNAINQQRHCFIPESKDPVIMAVTCAPVVDMLVADFKRDDEGSFLFSFLRRRESQLHSKSTVLGQDKGDVGSEAQDGMSMCRFSSHVQFPKPDIPQAKGAGCDCSSDRDSSRCSSRCSHRGMNGEGHLGKNTMVSCILVYLSNQLNKRKTFSRLVSPKHHSSHPPLLHP